MRRPNSGWFYAVVGLCATGIVGTLLHPISTGSYGVTLAAVAALAWAVLSAGLARFVVTAEEFRIETLFRIVRVPRHLIGVFEPVKDRIRLMPTEGPAVTFRVDSLLADLPYAMASFTRLIRDNASTRAHVTREIRRALSAVPAGPAPVSRWSEPWPPMIPEPGTTVTTHVRAGPSIAAAACALVLVAGCVLALAPAAGQPR